MDKVNGKLTVFFEEPFWVGIFERIDKLSVAKVTFGAEPKDYEVQEYIQKCYFSLNWNSERKEKSIRDIKVPWAFTQIEKCWIKLSGGVSMKKVLAIMLVAVSIMVISACGKKEKLYEIPNLSQYKTDYVGDSSNVINIVSGQEYPEGYSYDSIEIQSETEPYGLTVFLKDKPSAVKLEDELQANADMTFNLIGNLGTIDYKTADSKEIIESYERWYIFSQLLDNLKSGI